MSEAQTLTGGFADPAIDAAAAFRTIMDVMARPGQIQTLHTAAPPAPLSVAAGTVLLTLCDADTPLHLAGDFDTADVRAWIAFHTNAPLSWPGSAMFAVGTWGALMPITRFPIGTPEYPDRSTTLIAEVPDLQPAGATLRGPGIQSSQQLSLPDVAARQANHKQFPLGLDMFFTCGDRIAALPRSTEVS